VALPQFRSIVVRAGTPPDRVTALSGALAKVAATAEFKKFLDDQFADADSFIAGGDASEFVKAQLADMKKAMASP
jgi:tripartite-type tricarboxylate transporter receptor subunit TctC